MASTKHSLRTPLGRVRGLGSARSGTSHFWHQRLTALANVPLALAFIAIVVCAAGGGYDEALALVRSPLVALLLLLFILSATYHMRIGMQVIIEDYVHGGAKVAAVIANTFFALLVAAAAVFAVLKISFGGM
ncbi:succinate dehydrogenase, hydrophobic membrane anchor protein [Chelatococcus daeguensis]|uniref:Succinate dehydrogenase hydrophobic membrane anchor subunit n=2 Tax=Chelatococcus TaxID=28209 RepID=A0AAC9JNZ2_9HYPH|nr:MULTISPECIES: succinate dehydrogenase, hydrophobic membrane anchor protein [Chelatococcus]APF36250.1 succinate dehydrogenase, hydrophobic membrane anchor protein [Chelatococcus daeguensis]KZE30575.1 succinate dehydrogenase [Chelatococcus daeguensis]MBM3081925.1 succinate dehydrogenase, hydrophobic membrane anchor protein [Chelatococcus daeguensis]CUA89111.1 succinate dehydrogenase, hydrophobic membrane anchor protein [Chelatococcus sambhunathii]